MKVQEGNARWDAIMKECHFECSCGESFSTVDDAKGCRKCRTYTEAGYCTEVVDRDQDSKVVWSIKDKVELAETECLTSVVDDSPLTHNLFDALSRR